MPSEPISPLTTQDQFIIKIEQSPSEASKAVIEEVLIKAASVDDLRITKDP